MELSRFYHSNLTARVQTDRLESHCANPNFPQCMVRRPTARTDCWTKYSLRKLARHPGASGQWNPYPQLALCSQREPSVRHIPVTKGPQAAESRNVSP